MRNVQLKGVAALAMWVSGCSGSGGPLDSADADLLDRRVSDEAAARLPFSCAGEVTKGVALGDGHDNDAAQVYTCWPQEAPGREPLEAQDFYVDKAGKLVDLDWLRRLKRLAVIERHRFDAELIEEVAKRPTEHAKVHVWFDVPEGGSPPGKAEAMAMSETELAQATVNASRILRERASALIAAIEALPGSKEVLGMLGGEGQVTPMITLRASPKCSSVSAIWKA